MNEKEEYSANIYFLASLLGSWQSVNGNPDVFVYQGLKGKYFLIAYQYDKESERGCFSSYEIEEDEDGCYIRMSMKYCRLLSEERPYGLHITEWGSYMKD